MTQCLVTPVMATADKTRRATKCSSMGYLVPRGKKESPDCLENMAGKAKPEGR